MAGPYRTPVPLFAGGTIVPSTFVKLSKTADRQLLQAGSNDRIFGIAQVGSHDFQKIADAANAAAAVGQEVGYFIPGEPCLLYSGTGGWAADDLLKSDASGYGVVGVPGLDNIGARAIDAAVAGRFGYVVPFIQHAQGTTAAPVTAVTASTQLLAADAGRVISVTNATSAAVITLPLSTTLVAGQQFTVQSKVAPTSGAGLLVKIHATDVTGAVILMYGSGITTPAAGKGLLNTQATAANGDLATFQWDGTNWFVREKIGVWAREA